MNQKIPQGGEQHPPEWREDLNPESDNAGVNHGLVGPETEPDMMMASEIPGARDSIADLEKDDLAQLPVLRPGTRLEQGAVYVDLRANPRHEIKANASMIAGAHNWYVPKNRVDYQLWNRLIGVTNPERLGQASEG
jgi:hypothetical protein